MSLLLLQSLRWSIKLVPMKNSDGTYVKGYFVNENKFDADQSLG